MILGNHAGNGKPAGPSDRSFGLAFAGLFFVIAAAPVFSGGPIRFRALIASFAFLLISLIKPSLLSRLNKFWSSFMLLLQNVVSIIVLAVLFFLVVTPFGMIMRLRHKDALRLSKSPDSDSYWIDREPAGPTKNNMTNQF